MLLIDFSFDFSFYLKKEWFLFSLLKDELVIYYQEKNDR